MSLDNKLYVRETTVESQHHTDNREEEASNHQEVGFISNLELRVIEAYFVGTAANTARYSLILHQFSNQNSKNLSRGVDPTGVNMLQAMPLVTKC